MTNTLAWVRWRRLEWGLSVAMGGVWRISQAAALHHKLREIPSVGGVIALDLSELQSLDTTGALLIDRTVREFRGTGCEVRITGVQPEHASLIETVGQAFRPCEMGPPVEGAITRLLAHMGRATLETLETVTTSVAFFGRASTVAIRTFMHPKRLRLGATVRHMESAGVDALPIVCLMSFLIGIVLAYQGALQLGKFGADIFVVDLLAFSILRELGVLLTSIMVAGRSGSAFAAQIGSMRLHEEVDAMRVLGMDPIEVLVLPRTMALVLTLPLLTFVSDVMALLGGGLMAWVSLDIAPALFIERLQVAVPTSAIWVGLAKAPVFAAMIALVGCYEGDQVAGSAESVGHHTTRAVVESIFLVIVADAMFSIVFGILDI